MIYTPKTFDLPTLQGISDKQVKVHLALYEGYVKHVNLIADQLKKARDGEITLDPYVVAELRRRFAFEFDGMRMHEHYFEQFVGGASSLDEGSVLAKAATEKYGSVENFIAHIKEVSGSRGVGWVVVYVDPEHKLLHTVFVTDHELGQLAGLPIVLALDLWEHAFMVDYVPAEKKNYVDAFLANCSWSVASDRFENATNASKA